MEKNQVKIVIVGGSAGSLEVLLKVLPCLKPLETFALVLVLHRKKGDDAALEELIALKTDILVKEVEDKTPLLPGCIYIAPSDYHMLFETDRSISLDVSEKINYSRPSIDVSFTSAASAYGAEVVGILLSGANSDGTEGLRAIKEAGGTIAIQNPETAAVPFMPSNAIENLEADRILDTVQLLDFINSINYQH
ncbi:MAG TPA: chemotaxis protein CheB [Flavobacterium sp.]|nr:chemotaxis protein CheB [Flavobacterium sp.]